MSTLPPNETPQASEQASRDDDRWSFFRDVAVFQLKLVLGNLQNFLLVPVSIVAALLDLFFKRSGRHGERFYKVLEISRDLDERIDLYSDIGGYHSTGASASSENPNGRSHGDANVDTVIRRVEDVIVREYRKGGTAASVKAAVDRVLDELQRGTRN